MRIHELSEDLVISDKTGLRVYRNPSRTEVINLYREGSSRSDDNDLRALVGEHEIYVWDGYHSAHADIFRKLNLTGKWAGINVYRDGTFEMTDFNVWGPSGWSNDSEKDLLHFLKNNQLCKRTFGYRFRPSQSYAYLEESMKQTPDVAAFVDGFKHRHPMVFKTMVNTVVFNHPGRGTALAQQVSLNGREAVVLYPNFWKHFSMHGEKSADYVLMHELGHVLSAMVGQSNWGKIADELGIDLWDTPSLPWGQFNFEEAFAETFAVIYMCDRTGIDMMAKSWPQWFDLVTQSMAKI